MELLTHGSPVHLSPAALSLIGAMSDTDRCQLFGDRCCDGSFGSRLLLTWPRLPARPAVMTQARSFPRDSARAREYANTTV